MPAAKKTPVKKAATSKAAAAKAAPKAEAPAWNTIHIFGYGESQLIGGGHNGGLNNTVSHAYSAAFGKGIVSASTYTLHVNCLNAYDTPTIPGPLLPSGSIFRYAGSGLPAGALPLYIMP